MNKKLMTLACLVLLGLAAVAGSLAIAQSGDAPAGQAEMQLPPGWTMEDMQACIVAGTPGEQHKRLAEEVGSWSGKSMMWMAPGADPVVSDCTAEVTAMMDGRYTKCEMNGEMPGMGPYHGLGIYGFDNVSQEFVSTWFDNHSTGLMTGTGKLSEDGRVLTWEYTFNCPLTKKPALLREVETMTGPNAKTIEMFGADPKSGQEYKMMSIELKKQS